MLKNYTTEELIYNKDIQNNLIIDLDSDVYKGFKYGVNAIKEILEYPIVRLDTFIFL